jgi:hypothetical protein
MGSTAAAPRAPIGAILAILGGALLAVGSFLTWAEVSGGGTSVTAKGIDGSDGYITLVAGIVAIVAGLAMTRQGARLLAILAVLAGLIGGAVGLYDALTAQDSVLDTAAEEIAPTLGASVDEVRSLLDQAVDAGEISISISIGLYLVIGGGVLAFVGGLLAMRGRERAGAGTGESFTPPDTPSPAMPPPMPPTAPPSPPGGGTPSG